MGKTDEIGQLKPIKCTYKDCQKRFDSEKEMKYHKLAEPNHNYCKKCNADCEDWEDLTQHKVEAMTPFLDGGMKHNPDESPKHIVCEFCGMDFKSFGGRKRHREQVSEVYPMRGTCIANWWTRNTELNRTSNAQVVLPSLSAQAC